MYECVCVHLVLRTESVSGELISFFGFVCEKKGAKDEACNNSRISKSDNEQEGDENERTMVQIFGCLWKLILWNEAKQRRILIDRLRVAHNICYELALRDDFMRALFAPNLSLSSCTWIVVGFKFSWIHSLFISISWAQAHIKWHSIIFHKRQRIMLFQFLSPLVAAYAIGQLSGSIAINHPHHFACWVIISTNTITLWWLCERALYKSHKFPKKTGRDLFLSSKVSWLLSTWVLPLDKLCRQMSMSDEPHTEKRFAIFINPAALIVIFGKQFYKIS